MPMLKVRQLAKSFGTNRAVDGVSFQVSEGESYGLLGPNGAGKSTTINLILGLLTPDAGSVVVNGLRVSQKPNQARALVGFVPQEIALYPTLSARENLAFWGRMYGLAGKDLGRRIDAALETVGLADRARDRVQTFSGGMKRRVNIAAALLHSPKLLVMDEPTVGIDPQSRSHILETVKHLGASGITIVYTSHYMEEVEYLCARTGVMDCLRPLRGVESVTEIDGEFVISTLDPAGVLPLVMAEAALAGKIRSVSLEEPNLEAVFLHLTGRALRD